MISRVIKFFLAYRGATLFIAFLLGLVGWWSFLHLPIDAVPDTTNIQVQINTPVQGYAPEEIERYVTFPIERTLGGLPKLTQVRSLTRAGLSQVTVVFKEGTDLYLARQLVLERLQTAQAQLPPGINPVMAPISTGLGEIVYYSVEAAKPAQGSARLRQLMELKALQEYFIAPRLLSVPGVAEINTTGGFEKQFHVQPDPQKMAQWGISFSDIQRALEKTNRNVGGGYVSISGEQILIQGTGLYKNEKDILSTPVKELANLGIISVQDIAEVHLGKELRTGAAIVGGEEQVLGTVLMLIGENSRTVAQEVVNKIHEIQKDLPKEVQLNVVYDRSYLVDQTLDTVKNNLMTGAALVILILFLLLGNFRAALITAITIPLILLITFIFMRLFGISGNLMSLGALDFGILVDGVVIVLDNAVRLIQERSQSLNRKLSLSEMKETLWQAAVQVREAAGFGELAIVMIFIPILFLTGIEGKMFRPMAATFAIAIMVGLVLSFSVAPALASLLLPRDAKDREPWLMRRLKKGYAWALKRALSFRIPVLILGVISIVLGVSLFFRLGGEFMPQLNEGALTFQFVRPTNISLDQSLVLESHSQNIIMEFPEVSRVFARVGTSDIATDPMGVNLSDTYIMLKDKNSWPKFNGQRRSKSELAAAIKERLLAEIPAQRFLISQPIQVRFNELLEGIRADVSVKIFGDDMQTLAELGDQLADVIREIPGGGEVELEFQGTVTLLKVEPQEEIMQSLAMPVEQLLETIEIALGGQEVGSIFEGFRRYPIVVRLSDRVRESITEIEKLPIGLTQQATVPLKQIAKLRYAESYESIRREQSKRRMAVMMNPKGRDTQSFVREAKQAVEKQITLPKGYFLEWGGSFKNLQEAQNRLILLTPLALILVLMMIYAAFGSLRQTLMIFSCVPLALVGGVLSLMLNGLPFSIPAGIGFIALSGIAVLNGTVLINYYNVLEAKGLEKHEVIRQGSLTRLRPVLMTALVEALGFLPMMLSRGVGSEVQRPLASVVIGGIVSSTLLTLFVLPALYSLVGKSSDQKRSVKLATD